MAFLTLKDPATIKLMRAGMMEFGFKAQRLAHKAAKALGLIQDSREPPAGHRRRADHQDPGHPFPEPADARQPAQAHFAGLLDIEDDKVIPVIRNPNKTHDESDAVFYFPGCGSERLFSQVGLATQAMLYEDRRHDGAAAGLPVLRLPADLGR
jgi:Fe-S oxidoreductase